MGNFKEYIKQNIVLFDGAMGSMLQQKGLALGELPERWNLSFSDVITDIHKSYVNAGADVITTNTFGLNGLKFNDKELQDIAIAAIANAKKANPKYVAFDIGPTGRMLSPWGDLQFEEAVKLFGRVCKLAERGGADLILIETMTDSYETKAAVLGAKENTNLPIIVSNAYGADGKLVTGADPCAMIAMLEGLGVDGIGANCSLGPKQLLPIAEKLTAHASVPVLIQPNAGLPVIRNGETQYDISTDEFAEITSSMADLGVRMFGGCCGTNPEYIASLNKKLKGKKLIPTYEKNETVVSSYAKAVFFDRPILVGECLNPSGKKRLKEAIINQEMDYILAKGIEQEEAGADILDVNMGIPGTDEEANLTKAICELQSVSALPLQIDSANVSALEHAMRIYNGKPVVNSVDGKEERLNAILPLVKKYGGVLVCLCLDESGIPNSVEGRLRIAEKIIKRAAEYGISKKDLIFDALTLPVSADSEAASITLNTVKALNEELSCKTILGISNVSFGLPDRDELNANFFVMALSSSLSAGIINPLSESLMKAFYSFNALKGYDNSCASYISLMSKSDSLQQEDSCDRQDDKLQDMIIKGIKDGAVKIAEELLKTKDSLTIINEEIIPALNSVGQKYESKTIYLPQLLQSAEAAKEVFEVIKSNSQTDCEKKKSKIVLATVKGDIHDIGKNIVKLLLGNYGYEVIDLGKDVAPKKILDAVLSSNAPLCGLSALMTTTVVSMEETVALLKQNAPFCKIIVGGAVLTEEDAKRMNADFYAKDAMATVKYAEMN